jgi:YD repeat-containing protein
VRDGIVCGILSAAILAAAFILASSLRSPEKDSTSIEAAAPRTVAPPAAGEEPIIVAPARSAPRIGTTFEYDPAGRLSQVTPADPPTRRGRPPSKDPADPQGSPK